MVAGKRAFGFNQTVFAPRDFMAITKSVAGGSWEFAVSGSIGGAEANELEVEVIAAIRAGAREIFVNLSAAEWICSAGIRVLLQYYRQMKKNQKTLLVTRPSAAVEAILELTGFKDLMVESDKPRP
jgi:anti-anti-sigma factor